MNIGSNHTIDAAEGFLSAIDGTRTDTRVKLATNSHGQIGGGEASMVQAFVTWAQHQQQVLLRTYAASAGDAQVGELVRRLTGLSAVLLSDEVQADDGTDISTDAYRIAVVRYDKLAGDPASSRGPQFEILCADHLSLPLTPLLYDSSTREPMLRSEAAFRELAQTILDAKVMRSVIQPGGLVSAIGSALFELFKNTEDHARFDAEGNVPARALRGIHARRHERSRDDLDTMARAAPGLAPFLARLDPPAGRKLIRFAEFSVFDSGPGLASRWLKLPAEAIDADAEMAAIADCFEHRKTTKDSAGRGVGLPTVIAALQKRGGFLRIRTGRQSLCADLGRQADLQFGSAPAFSNFSGRGKVALAAGTLITFILPLDRSE